MNNKEIANLAKKIGVNVIKGGVLIIISILISNELKSISKDTQEYIVQMARLIKNKK